MVITWVLSCSKSPLLSIVYCAWLAFSKGVICLVMRFSNSIDRLLGLLNETLFTKLLVGLEHYDGIEPALLVRFEEKRDLATEIEEYFFSRAIC